MKKLAAHLFFVAIIIQSTSLFAQFNPILDSLARYINPDSIAQTVREMEAFGDRFVTRNNKDISEYLVQKLQNYGVVNARIDSFYKSGNSWLIGNYSCYMYNVKGRIEGNVSPDSTIIIGAHLDAISYDNNYHLYNQCPGADDNASGIAVMIEMARIIHLHQLTPELSIDFMGYDGEELGLFGSAYDAQNRQDSSEIVTVMLNNDMVGYQPNDNPWELMLYWYDNATDIAEKMAEFCENYTEITPIIANETDNEMNEYSDSYPYFQRDYKAIFTCEKTFSPYYHSLNDSVGFCNFAYTADIARMNFAALFDFARLTMPIDTSENIDTTEIPNSISNFASALSGVILYPNPANERIQLQFILSEATALSISFTDITGRTMEQFPETAYGYGVNHIAIDCSSFPTGLYFCHIRGKEYSKTLKWVVHR